MNKGEKIMKKRQQSESLKRVIEQVREKHKQFVEETGIDYKALAASGFDANSGRNLFSEIVEGFEYLKQERGMKEQGNFDVALRNMIATLNQGQSSDNPSIASFCKMVLDSWDKERGINWYDLRDCAKHSIKELVANTPEEFFKDVWE